MTNQVMQASNPDIEKEEIEVVEGSERTRPYKAYVPRADIYETDRALFIVADMPGIDENSVEIMLEKNVLSLRGVIDFKQPEDYSLAYAEYEIGDFERNFTLSDEIDRENIEASISDGVLRVMLPKAGPAITRKITVSAA
jgi:HSP20 family protein